MDSAQAEQVIFDLLISAADAGSPCPTNADLEEAIGSQNSTGSTAVGILARIEAKGRIKIERYQRSRRITIVATGAQTAMPANRAPHWRQRPMSVPAPSLPLLQAQKPDVVRDILVEARRQGRAYPDFLSDLVWAGWAAIQEKSVADSNG